MDLLQAFNIAMTIVAALGGWLLKSLFDRIRDLEKADEKVVETISQLRENLPTHYVRREDFAKALDDIFNSLRRIEDKLERKVDRP